MFHEFLFATICLLFCFCIIMTHTFKGRIFISIFQNIIVFLNEKKEVYETTIFFFNLMEKKTKL